MHMCIMDIMEKFENCAFLLLHRFIWVCNGFSANTMSMKLASSFVLSGLLQIHDEEPWSKSILSQLLCLLSSQYLTLKFYIIDSF